MDDWKWNKTKQQFKEAIQPILFFGFVYCLLYALLYIVDFVTRGVL